MNRLQIRRRVNGLLRDDTYPPEAVNEALNRVLLDINGLGRFRFQQNIDTVALVTGTYKYNITSTIIAEKLVVYQLADTVNQAILSKAPDMVDAVVNGAFLTSGIPTTYARWNAQWWFDPIPDATANGNTISILHYKDIAELSSDISTPGIPTRWHGSVLVYGIAADIAPGLMVRTPQGQMMVQKAYEAARRELLQQELWEPFTNKQLQKDPRWRGFESFGNVSHVR